MPEGKQKTGLELFEEYLVQSENENISDRERELMISVWNEAIEKSSEFFGEWEGTDYGVSKIYTIPWETINK